MVRLGLIMRSPDRDMAKHMFWIAHGVDWLRLRAGEEHDGSSAQPREWARMLSISVADEYVNEAWEAVRRVNARVPRQHRLSLALSHGESLFTLSGSAEGVMELLSEAATLRDAQLTPLPVAPFHSIHNAPALDLVTSWSRARAPGAVRPEHLHRPAFFGSPLNGQALAAGSEQLMDAVHFHVMYEPVSWGGTLLQLAAAAPGGGAPEAGPGSLTCCVSAGHGGLLGINTATFQRLPLDGPTGAAGAARLFACRLPLFSDAPLAALPASEPRRRAASASQPASQADIDAVQSALLDVLGRELPLDTPFLSAGVSSRDMVRVAERLQERTGRDLPPTALFDFPTVAALARLLGAPSDLALGPASAALAFAASAGADGALVVVSALASTLPSDPTPAALASAASGPRLGDRVSRAACLAAAFQDAPRPPPPRQNAVPPFCGALADPSACDADSLRLPPDEARYVDPQQRLLLEHALAAAGPGAPSGAGALCDVYAGISWNDYAAACKEAGLPHKACPFPS